MKNLFTTLFLLCTVAKALKQSDFLQFNLSMDKEFKDDGSILSKPVPWCVFNPRLLATKPAPKVIANDFHAGEPAYMLACSYENCHHRFDTAEQKQIETIIMDVLSQYYYSRILGCEENRFFDEHFWQFSFRHFLQSALVVHDKYPLAKEYLEYSYELRTSRAPATGFNLNGSRHNGANYFSANAVSLAYVATLFRKQRPQQTPTTKNLFQHLQKNI